MMNFFKQIILSFLKSILKLVFYMFLIFQMGKQLHLKKGALKTPTFHIFKSHK
jgi:hypothetical protein